tara:strand:- start:27 stop:434 length:408 start_codon:yes stop_codon:yes gene_type:complete
MINHEYEVKVYYKDIDQMGFVYYSRYFEYFEAARTELLSSIGLGVNYLEKEGIYLPVIASYCKYLKAARLEQILLVKTMISSMPKSKLLVKYSVFTNKNQAEIANGYTEHAFMNEDKKAVKLPMIISSRLNNLKK